MTDREGAQPSDRKPPTPEPGKIYWSEIAHPDFWTDPLMDELARAALESVPEPDDCTCPDIGELKDLQGIRSVADLSAKVKSLRQEVETLTMEKARKEEEFARREREVEHKVGLERKRQEMELAAAKREATLAVREENLKADQERFAKQMEFQNKRFTEEVGYLKDMIGSLAERLPNVNLTGDVHGKRVRGAR